MPIYAYKCESCGHTKDVLQKMSDAPLSVCPECGAPSFKKQLTAAGFQLKGSGWYVTDFRGGAPAGGGESDGASSGKSAEAGPATPAAPTSAPAPAAAAAPAAASPAPASSPSGTVSTTPPSGKGSS